MFKLIKAFAFTFKPPQIMTKSKVFHDTLELQEALASRFKIEESKAKRVFV